MIEASLSGDYKIFDISDLNDNELWISHVEKIVSKFTCVYTNGELERKLFKDAGYEVRETPFFDRGNYSGTEIRKRSPEAGASAGLSPCRSTIDATSRA